MLFKRIRLFQKKINQLNLDAFLISNFYNIFYLTGFKTLTENERGAWVLTTKDEVYLFSDGRYLNDKLKVKSEKLKVRLITFQKGLIPQVQEIVKEKKIKTIGFEGDDLRVNELQKLKEKINQVSFIATEKLIIKIREIKDDEEIRQISKSCQIADICLKDISKIIKIGMTEAELAFKIEKWLKEKGFNLAFYPIVAVDENSVIPHYDSRSQGFKKIKNHSVILIDFGVKDKDYVSDITRMIFMKKVNQQVINTYQRLLKIQQMVLKKSKFNVDKFTNKEAKKIDDYCRELFISNQLPNYPHSTGHGIGLEIHEYPKISQTSTDIIQSNQVFTIEPGVYFEGRWGMRLEDTVYVNKNLELEILTKFGREPLIF